LQNTRIHTYTKREYRIQLDELFSQEADRLIAQLDALKFPTGGPFVQSDFRSRVKSYEAATEPLARMAGVLGRWGDGEEFQLVIDLIASLYGYAEKEGGGLKIYLGLRSYPAVLIFTAYALGLTRAERWKQLHRLLTTVVARQYNKPICAVEALFLLSWKGTEDNVWKEFEGLEQKKTPFSERLLLLFSEWGRSFLGVMPEFELTFERYEVLGSLAWLEGLHKENVRSQLDAKTQYPFVWMPFGRANWDTANADRLVSEMTTEPRKSELLDAGFAKGDAEFLDLFIQNFKRMASVRWR
jgi:hypothetical protein